MTSRIEMTSHIEKRPAHDVMRLSRLGSFHQCRLSFMRRLTRQMAMENWQFKRELFEIDQQGVGVGVYTAKAGESTYSLVAFAHDLPDEMRSDRVIAEAWDATFTLFDGIPSQDDIARLSKNVPLQEAGRVSEKELSLSRANRSCRLWSHVVESLAEGKQPIASEVEKVGYLIRTTAVYGSGKFGAADYNKISHRPEMSSPFQAEMLSVYLTRWFARDLINHMAEISGGDRAIKLDNNRARQLGIGNSTGLGMAPFLVKHPRLISQWINARETAIAIVRQIEGASTDEIVCFCNFFERASQVVRAWQSRSAIQIAKIESLLLDIKRLSQWIEQGHLKQRKPWNQLMTWSSETLSLEGQEFIASLILEPYGDLVDHLADDMRVDEPFFTINGEMTLGEIAQLIADKFPWALTCEWDDPENMARCWYTSIEKLEPRLGERFEEDITAFEQPLAPGLDAARLYQAIGKDDPDSSIGEFLANQQHFRSIVRRLQMTAEFDYSEIHDNTISSNLLPIDLLRAKLSFFGATKFDPRSDRWLRITMYQGAPYPDELSASNCDFWVYPALPS